MKIIQNNGYGLVVYTGSAGTGSGHIYIYSGNQTLEFATISASGFDVTFYHYLQDTATMKKLALNSTTTMSGDQTIKMYTPTSFPHGNGYESIFYVSGIFTGNYSIKQMYKTYR